ncbi:hypothetical protein [Dinghuibacter silviterrae]|uniref:Uncharacterized protein n=1 Tax=Dinghuibacter silviterrae TaxID=1539049 RepID=A0A4R8DUI3_9BACT|nr:hypothetical protein [Dinghuibacter silviterrae]TDX01829.1 hypothetical protein EDB95_2872 [Dinghuibacter silviterrae]
MKNSKIYLGLSAVVLAVTAFAFSKPTKKVSDRTSAWTSNGIKVLANFTNNTGSGVTTAYFATLNGSSKLTLFTAQNSSQHAYFVNP